MFFGGLVVWLMRCSDGVGVVFVGGPPHRPARSPRDAAGLPRLFIDCSPFRSGGGRSGAVKAHPAEAEAGVFHPLDSEDSAPLSTRPSSAKWRMAEAHLPPPLLLSAQRPDVLPLEYYMKL